MEGLRRAALVLCAVLMLCTVAAAETEWDNTGSFDGDTTSSSPVIQPEQSEPSPGGAAPAVPDAVESRTTDESSSQMDDSLWGSYGTHNDRPNIEPPSEKQQELEEARRAWEEDQMQREEAFREAEQVTTEPPGEDKDAKKQPSAGNGTGDDAPTELTLPVQAPKPVSPVRYILIGALLAAALCIALYLFTHPVREEDDPEENQ
jgi:hypothetical protein